MKLQNVCAQHCDSSGAVLRLRARARKYSESKGTGRSAPSGCVETIECKARTGNTLILLLMAFHSRRHQLQYVSILCLLQLHADSALPWPASHSARSSSVQPKRRSRFYVHTDTAASMSRAMKQTYVRDLVPTQPAFASVDYEGGLSDSTVEVYRSSTTIRCAEGCRPMGIPLAVRSPHVPPRSDGKSSTIRTGVGLRMQPRVLGIAAGCRWRPCAGPSLPVCAVDTRCEGSIPPKRSHSSRCCIPWDLVLVAQLFSPRIEQ
jgi:hypothetical protein